MNEFLVQALDKLGTHGVSAIVWYKMLDTAEGIIIFCLVGYGIKKAWPHIKHIFD